jgi:osmotically-inducible protein OsmY
MLLTASLLVALTTPLGQTGFTDADIAILAHQSIMAGAPTRGLSADEIGRLANRRPDADVARDVRLLLKKQLGPEDISGLEVICKHGSVILRGHAVSEEVEEHAVQLADAVPGSRSIDNRLTSPSTAPKDEKPYSPPVDQGPVRTQIFAFLTPAGQAARDVSIVVHRGEVVIQGLASSFTARDFATSAVRQVPGTRLVRNEMEVRKRSPVEDDRLERLIHKKLDWSEPLRGVFDSMSVQVHDGIVVLTGRMDNTAQRDTAVDLAGGTPGIIMVDDRLAGPVAASDEP